MPSFLVHVALHDSSGGPRALRTRQLSFPPYSKHMLLLACFAMEDARPGDFPKVLEVRCQGARECWSCLETLLLLKCSPDLLLAFSCGRAFALGKNVLSGVASIFINWIVLVYKPLQLWGIPWALYNNLFVKQKTLINKGLFLYFDLYLMKVLFMVVWQ